MPIDYTNYYQRVLANPTATESAKAEARMKLGLQNSGQQQVPQNLVDQWGKIQQSAQQFLNPQNNQQSTYDTGNQQLNDMLTELNKVLSNITNQGQVVNPDIELTPAQISQFTEMASSQISPYYKSQIAAIQSDLSKSVENLQKQYDITKQGTEAEFKSSLGTSRENMAGSGLTFSGRRGATENQMVEAQNRSLDLNALQTEEKYGSALRTLEGQIGSANLPTLPQFQGYRATLSGEGGFTPSRTLNFQTTGGIMGTLPQAQKEAELLRLSKYKQAARENRSLDFYL